METPPSFSHHQLALHAARATKGQPAHPDPRDPTGPTETTDNPAKKDPREPMVHPGHGTLVVHQPATHARMPHPACLAILVHPDPKDPMETLDRTPMEAIVDQMDPPDPLDNLATLVPPETRDSPVNLANRSLERHHPAHPDNLEPLETKVSPATPDRMDSLVPPAPVDPRETTGPLEVQANPEPLACQARMEPREVGVHATIAPLPALPRDTRSRMVCAWLTTPNEPFRLPTDIPYIYCMYVIVLIKKGFVVYPM